MGHLFPPGNRDPIATAAPAGAPPRRHVLAVALAGRDRHPVLVGEAKWARSVDGRRLAARLREKARALPGISASGSGSDGTPVRLALCARDEVRDAPDDALVATAADIF